MTFKRRINSIRRKLMNSITKNIGSSYSEPKIGDFKFDDIKKILIIRPNYRLGNQLLLTPVFQEVINTFPGCEVDLFVKGGEPFPYLRIMKRLIRLFNRLKNHLAICLNMQKVGFL
jgi:hypothetical protein